jgi:hypothetical protein
MPMHTRCGGAFCGVSTINAPTKVLLLPINVMVNTYVGRCNGWDDEKISVG